MKGWRLLLWLGCFLATLGLVLPLWAQEVAPPPSRPTPLVIGGIPVLELQGGDYPSELRVGNVSFVIDQFLRPQQNNEIPVPEVRVLQDSNRQFTLALGEAGNFEATQRYLFTVTYADAAAASGIPVAAATLSQVQQVANRWAVDLERALREYRQDLLMGQWGNQPMNWAVSVGIALAVGVSLLLLWRGIDKASQRGQAWLAQRWAGVGQHWLELGTLTTQSLLRLGLLVGAVHISMTTIPLLRPVQRQLYFRIGQTLSSVGRLLTQPLPNSSLSISSLLVFVLLALVVYIVAHRLSLTIKQRFLRQFLDLGTQETVSILFKYVFTLIGILIILPFSGIDLSSLTVFAGAIGLGIGLGLQNLANNFLSYLGVLLERPIQIGDFVEVDNLLGIVDRISWRSTTIRTLDQVFVIVPNSRFMESKVVNWSYRERQCRIHVPVGVDYRSDPNVVRQALLKVAADHPQVLETPAPQVWLRSFEDSCLHFELLVWIDNPTDQFRLKSELNYAIMAEFKRRNIEIPFPQRDLHIRTGLAPLAQWLQSHQPHNSLENPADPKELS
ncbi:MAG: mechanosensitive ion channel [Thermostichales cyanobacterium BF4_bins_65]